MGLFDSLFSDENASQLALAAGLLGGKGNLGQIVGSSLMQGQAAGQGAAERKRQAEMDALKKQQFQMALDEAMRQKKQADAMDQFRASIPEPSALGGVDFSGGQLGPTPERAAQVKPTDPMQKLMYGAMKAGALNPMDFIKSQQKDRAPQKVAAGEKVYSHDYSKVLAENPKEDAGSPIAKLIKEMEALPPNHPLRPVYQQAIMKAATHQEPVSINNFGSPLPIDLGGGKTGYIQPPTRPGGPSQVLGMPGTGQPAIKPNDTATKDLTEAQAKATALLGQMRSASAALGELGYDQSALSSQAEVALAGGPANVAIKAKAQQVRQTQDQWSEAFLRFKTGAATTKDEVANNRKTFFPVIGDKPETIAQKKRMREQAEMDMMVAAGRGSSQLDERQKPAAPKSSGGFSIIGVK